MQRAEYAGSADLRPGTKVSLGLVALCLLVLAGDILSAMTHQLPGAGGEIADRLAPVPPGRVSFLGMSRKQVEERVGVPCRVMTRKTPQGVSRVFYYQRRRGPGFLRVEYWDGAAQSIFRVPRLP